MTREEYEYKKELREIQREGEKHLLKAKLKAEREKYWPKKKVESSKIALAYILLSSTAVQIYSMVAMWHFMDLTALGGLIAATVGEALSYCAYLGKSAKQNTVGGITYEMAIRGQEQAQEGIETEAEGNG